MANTEQRVIPSLRMTDYQRSKAFYVERLGFSIEWEHRFGPTMPVFMMMKRDGMEIYLTGHNGDCKVGGLVHFVIDDVTAWHHEFEAKGVKASDPPNDDLGFLNMTVTDPDGNQLRFMERAKKDTAPA